MNRRHLFEHGIPRRAPRSAAPGSVNLSTFGNADPATTTAAIACDNGHIVPGIGDPQHPGRFGFTLDRTDTGGATLTVMAPGYVTVQGRLQQNGEDVPLPVAGGDPLELDAVMLHLEKPPRPDPPTRQQACEVRMHFQGQTIHSPTYGPLPWFSAALPSMDLVGELDSTIAQLVAAGDTHIPIDIVWDYGAPGQPWGSGQLVPPRDLRDDLDEYCRICDTVISTPLPDGTYARPIFVMLGEGREGFDWLMANLERVVKALDWRLTYGPICVWYDGVWPAGWSVQMMEEFLPFARRVIGESAYLMMMFAGGAAENQYLVVKGLEDYDPGGLIYENLDIFHCTGGPHETEGEALGQIASRMLGPAFVNDVDGYSGENASGAIFYPQHGCRRGSFFWGWIEWECYGWVRLWVTAEKIEADRARMRRCGVVALG